ncbi:MAG: gluconokinase [Variovorax sp.]|jgi:gluconokinase|nr:gluconokinase [Variovorax sp.]
MTTQTSTRDTSPLPLPLTLPIKPPIPQPVVLVVMGVSGCGKTTVAALLAGRLGWPFEEGDALHPPANIEKMKAGHPLDDNDRAPWLEKVADWVGERLDAGGSGLITCSALKRSYRDTIDRRGSGVVFVYLHGSYETIAARLAARHGHFMPTKLLDSQFADLQEPGADEPAIRVDVGPAPSEIADTVIKMLGLDITKGAAP